MLVSSGARSSLQNYWTAISVLFMVSTARDDTNMISTGLAYWALTISFNIILTVLISGRLWIAKRHSYSHPETNPDDIYERIADIMIESAAIYSIFGIIQLVAYTRGYDGLRRLFQGALGQVQVRSLFNTNSQMLNSNRL